MKHRNIGGFNMIEVMVALLVFSFGLLAVAGVMGISVKNNHNGYLRSQANFQAASILEAMRRNVLQVWQNGYNGTVSGYTNVSDDCTTSDCTSAELAQRDLAFWGNSLNQTLPNASGTVNCSTSSPMINTSANLTQPFLAIEPYSGICTITVRWTESNETSGSEAQTLILQGTP